MSSFWVAFLVIGLLASVWIAVGPTVTGAARRAPGNLRTIYGAGAIACGVAGTALAGWTAYAFLQQATEMRTDERTVLEHVSSIGYVPVAAPGTTPTDGMLDPVTARTVREREPAPLYANLVGKVDFGFNYEMRAAQTPLVMGYGGAALRIRAEDGWERTLPLLDAQLLSGPQVTLWFSVDLAAVRMIIADVEQQTGSRSTWYELTVIPIVRLGGDAGGEAIAETYTREFAMRLDAVRLTPSTELEHAQRKVARAAVEGPRHVPVGPLSLPFRAARWAALAGTALATAGALGLMVASDLKAPDRSDEPATAPGG